jgi:hypothetical protein
MGEYQQGAADLGWWVGKKTEAGTSGGGPTRLRKPSARVWWARVWNNYFIPRVWNNAG